MEIIYHSFEGIPEEWPADIATMDSDKTLVLIFAASHAIDKPEVFESLSKLMPASCIAGCSTSGEIHNTEIYDDSLVIAVTRFTDTNVRMASVDISEGHDSHQAGQQLANELKQDDLKTVLVFSEGLNINGTELTAGISETLGADVAVTGGLAGDGSRFERTWVLSNGRISSDQIVAVGLYGDKIHVSYGSKGGWAEFGIVREVTASDKNILHEIDGEPALDVYKKYLGEQAKELPASALWYPIAICPENEGDEPIVRTVLAVDEDSKSMTFAGNLPTGCQIQLMRTNLDDLVDAAEDVAEMTCKEQDIDEQQPVLSIAVSCVGRRLVMGGRTEDEIEAVHDVLPEGAHLLGFYSYGEISPYVDGTCSLHNQTMTLTSIWED